LRHHKNIEKIKTIKLHKKTMISRTMMLLRRTSEKDHSSRLCN